MVKRKKVNSIFPVRKIFLSHSSVQKGSSVPQQSKLLFHPPKGIFPFTPKSKPFYSLFHVHGGRLLGIFLPYRKIPKISLGAYIFQKPFMKGLFLEGLILGGAYVRREICVSKSIGLACSGKEICHFCFVLLCI